MSIRVKYKEIMLLSYGWLHRKHRSKSCIIHLCKAARLTQHLVIGCILMALGWKRLNSYAIMTYSKIRYWWWSTNNKGQIGYFSTKTIYWYHHAPIVGPCRNWILFAAVSLWHTAPSSARSRIRHSMKVDVPTMLNQRKRSKIPNYQRNREEVWLG